MCSPCPRPYAVAIIAIIMLSTALAFGGGFQNAVNYTVNPYPTGIVQGDFNGDGKLDLVVAVCGDQDCGATGSVQVLLGNGDGTFSLGGIYVAGPDGTVVDTMTAGDFNGDGVPDVAAVNSAINEFGTVSILMGDGIGGFLPPVSYSVDGAVPVWAAVGDFNGDGTVDLAVSVTTTAVVSVLLGNGDSTFQGSVPYAVESGVQGITVGDVNHDHQLDIVTANECGNDPACRKGTVSVLLGNGDGTFQPELSFFAGIFPLSVGLGDFNRNGNRDIAVALPCGTDPTCVSNGGVGILLGKGDGTFKPVVNYPSTGPDTARLAVADFNGDHHPDIVATNTQVSDITVFLANLDGTLQNGVEYGVSLGPIWMALGDFNGDHAIDLAVANEFGFNVSILLNTGGAFVGLTSSPNPSQAGQQVTFTATITPSLPGYGNPSGTVAFRTSGETFGTAPVVNGTATLSYANLPTGDHKIRAVYSGDPQYNPSSSSRITQVVNP
jgi:hypothetical protein